MRYMGNWLNLSKNTVQKRVTALLDNGLMVRAERGGIRGSASYTITPEGLAVLEAMQVPSSWTDPARDLTVYTEKSGTWYRGVPIPDAMRDAGLRGPWELWRSLPHEMWFTPEDVLPYVTATTTRTVRDWTKALAGLAIPLAEWGRTGTQFQLLDADPGVFAQLRAVQEDEAAAQNRVLRSRAELERSHIIDRIRADEAIEKRKRQA